MKMDSSRLKLDLFCRGAQLALSCMIEEDTRPVKRTRGGLGSGLDAILPGNVWVNIPVEEPFAWQSPYVIRKEKGEYHLYRDHDATNGEWKSGDYISSIQLPPQPHWYDQLLSSGRKVGDTGVMQGTYFAVYPSALCQFWKDEPRKNCRFCSVGLCHGKTESAEKSIQDVVEAVRLARKHECITFVHFNTGFIHAQNDQNGGVIEGIDIVLPYVRAVKEATGLLIGVQCPPSVDLSKYDQLRKAGADHASFCFELFDPDRFQAICPGKADAFGHMAANLQADPLLQSAEEVARKHLQDREPHPGQLIFYRALAYCLKTWRKGLVSGEIIAGLEPAESSIAAIDFLGVQGAVTTVCVFRPCIGTDLEAELPPRPEEVAPVLGRMYESCVKNRIPIGVAPNIKTAMVHLPQEGVCFTDKPLRYPWFYRLFFILGSMALRCQLAIKKTLHASLCARRVDE